ncbi:hypothetical protein Fmac_010722 [Flemingia macrophylla]|uniref:Uncharacterized protein n=1 Tax=Flemingia macrophylla TaxID=520843 RepID=A0ABD1MKD4_9FABA
MSTYRRRGDDGAILHPHPLSASRRFSSPSLQKENFSSNPRRSTSHKTFPRDRSSSPSDLPRSLSAQEPLRFLFRRDFDAFDMRMWLPVVVSKLYKAINSNGGVTYIHCTAALEKAPAVARIPLNFDDKEGSWFLKRELPIRFRLLG